MRFNFIICLLIISLPTFAQRFAKNQVSQFHSLSLDSDYTWLGKVFDKQIKDEVNFIGLGEFTHGGEETILFKSKMIQYLVREKGYRQILLEYPNVVLHPLNDYLKRRSSTSLDSITMIAQGLFGRTFLGNTSFYGLMIWIKQFNLTHPDDTISLRGIDIEGASEAFADYFMSNYLLPIDRSNALEISSKWKNSFKDSVALSEVKWFHKHSEILEKRLGKVEYQTLSYDIKAVEDKLIHGSLQEKNIYKASAFRDSIMAANIVSANGSKSIIWAHNLHITTSDYVVSTGNYLKKMVGKQYYTILTDFSLNATIWAISNDGALSKKTYGSNKKTAAYQLNKKQGVDQGIVFFDDLKTDQIRFNSIDRAGNQVLLGRGYPFDALVVFNNVKPFVFK